MPLSSGNTVQHTVLGKEIQNIYSSCATVSHTKQIESDSVFSREYLISILTLYDSIAEVNINDLLFHLAAGFYVDWRVNNVSVLNHVQTWMTGAQEFQGH